MMTFISKLLAPESWGQDVYQTTPDINGGPNRASDLTILELQATFPSITTTARGKYMSGQDVGTGRSVHLGEDGWMVGQEGCIRDGLEVQGPGVSSVDLPDMSWCGVNDWVDRNRGLAAVGLVALFFGTKMGARKIRERRAK